MNTSTILDLVKARLGITTNIRDNYIKAIIEGVIKELEDEKGLALDDANPYHLMFVVDYSAWRYQSVNATETTSTSRPLSMPRHLQFRLHNLMIHANKESDNNDL